MLSKDKLMKFEGTLQTHWETGFENAIAITFHDNRGVTVGPTFNNETQKYDGPSMEYHSMGWTMFLDKHFTYYAKIYKKDGSVWYEGPLTFSRERQLELQQNKDIWMFVPEEIDDQTWFQILRNEPKAELWTNDLPYNLEKQCDVKYRPGHIVFDNVSQQNVAILNRYIDENEKLHYTVSVKENNERTQDQFSKHTLSHSEYFDFMKAVRDLENE